VKVMFLDVSVCGLLQREIDKWVIPLNCHESVLKCMEFCDWVLIAIQDNEYFGWVSWMVWPQNPSRLCLFEPLSSFATCVVVVRLPVGGLPSRVPVPCCILVTVAITAPEISWSQVGSRDGSSMPIGGWPVM